MYVTLQCGTSNGKKRGGGRKLASPRFKMIWLTCPSFLQLNLSRLQRVAMWNYQCNSFGMQRAKKPNINKKNGQLTFCCCCCQTRIGVAIASGERRLPLKQTKILGLFLVTTSVVRKLVYFLDATSRSHSLDLSTCGEISSACFPFLSRLSTFYEYYLKLREIKSWESQMDDTNWQWILHNTFVLACCTRNFENHFVWLTLH